MLFQRDARSGARIIIRTALCLLWITVYSPRLLLAESAAGKRVATQTRQQAAVSKQAKKDAPSANKVPNGNSAFDINVRDLFNTVKKEEAKNAEEEAKKAEEAKRASDSDKEDKKAVEEKEKKNSLVFVTSDPSAHILPPDQDPKVRVNPEAPGPFVAMMEAYQSGDQALASSYANQLVRYYVNIMFQLRDVTQLVGQAMIKQGLIDEEDWGGVEQYLDIMAVKAKSDNNFPLKITHDEAMSRVKADPKAEAHVYFFMNLSNANCREMATSVERLARSMKGDSRVKMTAIILGQHSRQMLREYRNYTGLSIPMLPLEDIAKAFRVRFVPTIIVVAPNLERSYMKTGEQGFGRLYQFVRTVQGLPAEATPELEQLAAMPISYSEKLKHGGSGLLWEEQKPDLRRASLGGQDAKAAKVAKESIDRF